MLNLNNVLLSGILDKEPERIRHHSGKLVRLSLLTEESHLNDKGRLIRISHIHPLTAWGNNAELAERFLKKGSRVYVEGKLIHNYYYDRMGVRRKVSEVKISGLKILD
jgi:single-strand DNA-binding protein